MKCSKCGFENIDSANYCINCGSRMDNKIFCPNCGQAIDKNVEKCPNCKRIIPHKSNTNEPGIKRASKVFNLIFNIVIIILLCSSLMFVWGSYLTSYGDNPKIGVYAHSYLFTNWKSFAEDVKLVGQASDVLSLIIVYIVPFLVVLANVVITYLFAIKGIIKAASSFRGNDTKCLSFSNLGYVTISNITSLVILTSVFPQSVSTTGSVVVFTTLSSIALIAMSIIKSVLSIDRNNISAFVERLLCVFAIMLTLIAIFNIKTYYSDSISVFKMIELIKNINSKDNKIITSAFLSGSEWLFKVFELIFFVGIIVIFAKTFFGEEERTMKHKIPLLALSIAGCSMSVFQLILHLSTYYLLQGSSIKYSFNAFVTNNVMLSIGILGFVIASFILTKKANINDKLIEITASK